MRNKIKLGVIFSFSIFLFSLLFSTEAQAIMSDPYGWYFDVNVGESKLFDINLNGGSKKSSGVGGDIGLGYKFMPYFGLEIGYTKYANSKVTDQYGVKAGTLQSYSYDLSLKGIMPVYDSGMELFAKFGVQRGHTRFQLSDMTAANNILLGPDEHAKNSSHTGVLLGVGAEYYFWPELGFVGQWARAQGNNSVGTLDLYSIGVTFTFG